MEITKDNIQQVYMTKIHKDSTYIIRTQLHCRHLVLVSLIRGFDCINILRHALFSDNPAFDL